MIFHKILLVENCRTVLKSPWILLKLACMNPDSVFNELFTLRNSGSRNLLEYHICIVSSEPSLPIYSKYGCTSIMYIRHLTFRMLMDFSILFDATKLEWFIVYMKVSQARISEMKYSKQCRPWWNAAFCLRGFPVYDTYTVKQCGLSREVVLMHQSLVSTAPHLRG